VRIPLSRPAALLVAGALAVAACSPGGGGDGGGDSAASTTSTPPWSADMTDTELATEAYVAGYPLVVTTRTMQRLGGLLGVNHLFWQNALAGPGSRVIVAPNRDTLYSIAVLDLRSEPVVLTLPAVTDRYYTYQFLDAWTDSFAYVGTRATGGRTGSWVIAPPGWDGDVPAGAEVVEAPTPQVFLLGRFLVDDEADIANVTAISRATTLLPLSAVAGTPAPPAPPPLGQPAGTAQDIPADATFFAELAGALAVNAPVTPAQRDLFARAGDLDPASLAAGAAAGAERITATVDRRGGDLVNGWSVHLDIGTYGDDTLLRAFVARIGWGANVPAEAVYPVARVDADGAPLTGGHTYRLRFPAGGLPPVDAFWSLSVYGADMFFAEHPSGRYAVGDRTPGLVYGDDGSLELVLSATEPADPADRANWLPVPPGPFVLMLRLYLPTDEVLDGGYDYPPVERADG
jgi:hypothetical protein